MRGGPGHAAAGRHAAGVRPGRVPRRAGALPGQEPPGVGPGRPGRLGPGRGGGYRLGRSAERITLLDVVEAVDGTDPFFRCTEIRKRGPARAPARAYAPVCAIAGTMARAEDAWRAELRRHHGGRHRHGRGPAGPGGGRQSEHPLARDQAGGQRADRHRSSAGAGGSRRRRGSGSVQRSVQLGSPPSCSRRPLELLEAVAEHPLPGVLELRQHRRAGLDAELLEREGVVAVDGQVVRRAPPRGWPGPCSSSTRGRSWWRSGRRRRRSTAISSRNLPYLVSPIWRNGRSSEARM